jgi:peptide/nickel transport system permease protein
MIRTWQMLRKSRSCRAGSMILSSLVLLAIFADLLASDLPILLHLKGTTYVLPSMIRPPALRAYDNQRLRREVSGGAGDWAWMPLCEFGPEQQPEILRPPPADPDTLHWLGTDNRGRDVFARLIHGTRASLSVGFVSVGLAMLLGLMLGVFGGCLGGWVDNVLSRLVELGLTFQTFFLILIVMALLGQTSLFTMMVVLGLTRWTDVARLARAEVLRLKELDFITAARVCGAGPLRIMVRHLVPNALGPVLVSATFGVASAILVESGLSFLGFGVPPPMASWGEVLSQAVEHPGAWWLTLCPGLLIFLTVSGLNLLGEGLRDALDPRSARKIT